MEKQERINKEELKKVIKDYLSKKESTKEEEGKFWEGIVDIADSTARQMIDIREDFLKDALKKLDIDSDRFTKDEDYREELQQEEGFLLAGEMRNGVETISVMRDFKGYTLQIETDIDFNNDFSVTLRGKVYTSQLLSNRTVIIKKYDDTWND